MVDLEEKREMVERCLMAASLAALVCHPNATIKCFRPKSQKEKPHHEKKQPSKSNNNKNNNDFRTSSLSRTSVSFNMKNMTTSSSPTFPTSRSGRVSYLVSKLSEDEPSFGVVETIFKSGWDNKIGLKIEKVLKINHGVDVLNKLEQYREIVKSKSTSKISSDETKSNHMERLAVDGNELLRFYGAIVTCSLGNEELSNICHRECCGICRIVSSSLSSEAEESVSLSKNSRQAHKKVVTTKLCVGNNYKIGTARKAVVICRVIAGRVARCSERGLVDGEEGGFDSVVSLSKDDQLEGSEELIVLNARAVLPCFIVVYNVKRS